MWFFVLSGLIALSSGLGWLVVSLSDWMWWTIGLVVGAVLPLLDLWLYRFYDDQPGLSSRHWASAQLKLVSRSILITIALVIVTLYGLTSTASIGGWGVILGWHLHTLSLWWRWSANLDEWWRQVGWQVQTTPSSAQKRSIIIGYAIFVALSLALMMWRMVQV